jgi:bacillopeptidase F
VVTALDYSSNESAYSNEISITIHRPTIIYSDNFDSNDDNGWTHSGAKDEWERGVPTATGGPASAVSLPNVWATDLDNSYDNSADASLYSPLIDLSGVSNATATFEHWFEIETNYDFGYVEISSNQGDTWAELGKFSHSSAGKAWTPVYYNLDKYVGKTVQLRFRLKSDSSVTKLGWYIDNFKVLSVAATESTKNVLGTETKAKDISLFDGPEFKLSYTTKEEYNASLKDEATKSSNQSPTSLPASATVTVLETGRSVKTDPSTGRFSFNHAAGDYTLKAEAYGYYAKTLPVSITDGTNVKANFKLDEIPSGTVQGIITDEQSGEPIADATILVIEDASVTPVQTGVDGAFNLTLLEGSYTLAISAKDYNNTTVDVTVKGNANVEVNTALKPFIGFPGEISYDDGTPENARAFNAAGNAWAVRFTPESESTQVTGASLRFWNTDFPSPGGTAFQYAVYDASGANGAPGRQLAGPFDATALRNNQWTVLELPEAVNVKGDFYIVYIQTTAGTAAPGLATDESSPKALRSWQRASGAWSLSPEVEGNYMIRATVRYPLGAPEITSPVDGSFTNTSEVTIVGTTPANDAEVKIYKGTELLATSQVVDHKFNIPVELSEGLNELTARVFVNGKGTDLSTPIKITVDTISPTLTITSPTNNETKNVELIHVIGTVTDLHLDKVEVNDQAITLDENGAFDEPVIVRVGENIITVKATDKAGNTTTQAITVVVNLTAPEIQNLMPTEDIHIKAGESFTVAFDSTPGLQAAFRVEIPLLFQLEGGNVIPFTETTPGHYEASYQTPATLKLDGGIIVVQINDPAGNKTEQQAQGKLYVTTTGVTEPDNNTAPVAVIDAKDSAKKSKNVKFNASKSYDLDGTIVSYAWQFGDGSEAEGMKAEHRYNDPGTFTVQLTVTDDQGATHTAFHQINIK